MKNKKIFKKGVDNYISLTKIRYSYIALLTSRVTFLFDMKEGGRL